MYLIWDGLLGSGFPLRLVLNYFNKGNHICWSKGSRVPSQQLFSFFLSFFNCYMSCYLIFNLICTRENHAPEELQIQFALFSAFCVLAK